MDLDGSSRCSVGSLSFQGRSHSIQIVVRAKSTGVIAWVWARTSRLPSRTSEVSICSSWLPIQSTNSWSDFPNFLYCSLPKVTVLSSNFAKSYAILEMLSLFGVATSLLASLSPA